MYEKDAEHIGIWGRSKSGKTTRAKVIIRGEPRLVVFDLLDEYADVAPVRAETETELLAAIRAGWGSGFHVRFVPMDGVDPVAELDMVARSLERVQVPYKEGRDHRKIVFLVDEMAASFPNVRAPGHAFAALCQRGRHYGIAIIGTSQRMAEVSTTFRGQTSTDYFFPLRTANDLSVAVQMVGKEQAETLKNLQNHEFLSFKEGRSLKGKN